MIRKILLFAGILSLCTIQMKAQSIVGLTTDGKLFSMAAAATPGTVTTPVSITGVTAGMSIVSIDYRPNTGQLYGLAYEVGPSMAQLYTIDAMTGVATAIGTPVMLALGTGNISMDFNPTVDRIRVVGANKKNYRMHPVTGAIAATDLDLNYATGDINMAATPAIGACAYTNSYIGSEATTLYDFDESLNVIATQNPPNNGTLNTVGNTGIVLNPTNKSAGMDIFFNPATGTNMAYLNANIGAGANDNLYTVNLATGLATNVGMIGAGLSVRDIAVVIDRTLPAVTGKTIYALTKTNSNFISFDSDNPQMIRTIATVTGLTVGQSIVGMDYRPATRTLYALGYNAAMKNAQLYMIDPMTAAATAVNGTPVTIDLDSATLIGFDFNPTVDRIRVVNAKGKNYRLNPNDGSIAATDMDLQYAAGDPAAGIAPRVATVAYTNSFAGATTTTLFAIDDSLKNFVTINPPNNGTLNTTLANLLPLNAADRTSDMDFFYDSTTQSNMGFLAANTATVNDTLYTITTAGAATKKGSIGFGIPIADLAVQLRFSGTLGIAAATAPRERFLVYPNPATNKCMIALPKAPGVETNITITDLTGKLMSGQTFDGRADMLSLSVNELPAGIYIIQIKNARNTYEPVRLLKQ